MLPRSSDGRAPSLRSHLLALTLVTLLPMIAFAVVASVLFAQRERATFRRGATERTLALRTAVDAELAGSITALQALATSDDLASDNFRAFHAEATRVLRSQPRWLTINLAPPSGQQVVNVLRPFGVQLPVVAERPSFNQVLETGKPTVSNLVRDQITGPLDFAVRVPIIRHGVPTYVLSAVVKPEAIAALLAVQRVPPDWVVEVLDSNQRIVARTLSPERTLGQLTSETLLAALARAPEGWFRGQSLEGADVYTAFNRSAFSGWTVAMGIPAAVLQAPVRATAWAMGTGIVASGATAFLLAFVLGRRISAPIVSLAAAARAIGRGEPWPIERRTRIDEVGELSRTLDEAASAIRSREETQGYLAAIVETSTDAILSFAVDGTILTWNSGATRLFGYTAEDSVGRHVAMLFPTNRVAGVESMLAAASRGESPPSLETFAVKKDWTPTDVAVTVSPIRNRVGGVTGVSAIVRDISESKRAERALRDSEARLATLTEAMPQLVWTADANGDVEYFNRRWYDFTGTTRAQSVGRGWIRTVHPDDQPIVKERWEQALGRGEPTEIESRLRGADGRYQWFLSRGVPFRDADGEVMRWFGTFTNIEGQKRAEASLRATDRAKDEFLAMLGHELRNPLGAIVGAARVLQMAGIHGEAAGRAGAVIARQVEHLSRLVDDLLDVSRVTMGKALLSRNPLDLAEVVAHAMSTWRASGRLDRHRVSVDVSPVWVDADETRIEQILSNLLGNALKYTPTGGDIAVRVRREDDSAVLEVTDTGAGIPPELVNRMFDLFVQGERGLDRRHGGLGIGLTLVRRLVELHGGRVTAASEGSDRGSMFTVRLPSIKAPARVAEPVPVRTAESRRRRILIVEDNDDAREMLQMTLALAGHEVHEAPDGPAGLERALAVRPDVALIDVGLPGLDGYEVARRLRAGQGGDRIVLIAITGYGQAEDRRRALDAGFDAHLTKPVEPERLAELIEVRVDRR
jgi:PAS domain S-box-containing protein